MVILGGWVWLMVILGGWVWGGDFLWQVVVCEGIFSWVGKDGWRYIRL